MATTDKETYPFRFAGFDWTLVTKIQKDYNKKLTLFFYLKLLNDNDNKSEITNKLEESYLKFNSKSSEHEYDDEKIQENSRIITVYYQFKCNGFEVSKQNLIESMHSNKNQMMLLWKIDHGELKRLELFENEFSVNMNLEIIYSEILTEISKNIEIYYQSTEINSLILSEIFTLLRNIPKISNAQDAAFDILCRWGINIITYYMIIISLMLI